MPSITPYGQHVESVCQYSWSLTSHSVESVVEVRYGSKKRPLLLPTPQLFCLGDSSLDRNCNEMIAR